MLGVLLVALVMASIAAPVSAQQPAPAPPPQPPREDILDEIDTPEEEASRDLEKLGERATRAKACKRMREGHPTDPVREKLRYAVRYYARAHGLNPNVDELIDELEIRFGLRFRSDPQLLRSVEEGEAEGEAQKRWGKGYLDFWKALSILRKDKAREASAPAPRGPVSATEPARDKGGLSKNAKIAIGAGAGVVLVGVVAAGGGSDSLPSTSPTPPPPLAPFNPAGIYDVTLTVRSDPGGNAPRIGMEPSVALNVTVAGSTMQYTCPPGTHINPGGGPVDLTTGAFNAAGSGPFAGRSGVQFLFPGTFSRDGTVTGEYRVGTAGELGQVTTYGVNGRKRP